MKFFNLKSMIGMFLILFMAACQDDTGSGAKVEEGLAAKLNLSIQVPAVEEVNTRAIADNESQIRELALFLYSENGSSVNYSVNLTSYLRENGTTGNGYRTYSLNGDVPVKTGTFTVYAVANWSSQFANCDLGSYVTDGVVPSQADLKAMLAQNSSVLALGSGYLPMTCVVPNVTFSVAEEDGTNSLSLSLKRATARIEFTVQNGEALNAVQGEFIPSTFQVFNLPSSSYLFDQGDNMVLTDYFNSAEMAVNEDGSFEFLMNENVRPASENINEYQDREIYEGDWMNPTSFKNAPEGSTYVVINGYYRDNRQSGPVSYRIHLGNFSSTGSITNFTVNRNEQHKYSVTVNGIEKISTDVNVNNPGAYGDIEVRALQFTSEPTIQDAHYVIYPIDIKAENVSDGKLTSNVSWLTLRTDLTDLEKEGYWIEEDRGTQSIDIPDGTTRVYAFLEENIGNDTREATLSLYQEAYSDFKDEFVVQQYPVSWNGNIGCERIEDGTYPWGFYWDSDFKLIYDMTGCSESDRTDISLYIRWTKLLHALLPSWFPTDLSYVDHKYSGGLGPIGSKTTTVTINFGDLSVAGIAENSSNGLANTDELYNFNGISQVSSMIALLQSCSGFKVSSEGSGLLNPTEYAARACAKLNKFNKEHVSSGETSRDVPVLKDENFVWYLPSRQEAPRMKDDIIPLSGDYWTSTAAGDNQTAYKYTAGNTSADQTARRDVNLNVRAVRKR